MTKYLFHKTMTFQNLSFFSAPVAIIVASILMRNHLLLMILFFQFIFIFFDCCLFFFALVSVCFLIKNYITITIYFNTAGTRKAECKKSDKIYLFVVHFQLFNVYKFLSRYDVFDNWMERCKFHQKIWKCIQKSRLQCARCMNSLLIWLEGFN